MMIGDRLHMQADMMLFFGLLGVCNAVIFGPLVLLLGWSHFGTITPHVGLIIVSKGESAMMWVSIPRV